MIDCCVLQEISPWVK